MTVISGNACSDWALLGSTSAYGVADTGYHSLFQGCAGPVLRAPRPHPSGRARWSITTEGSSDEPRRSRSSSPPVPSPDCSGRRRHRGARLGRRRGARRRPHRRRADSAAAAYPAAQARASRRARAAIPLPAGGTFNGVRWEHGGARSRRARSTACSRTTPPASGCGRGATGVTRRPRRAVLERRRQWPAFRGTESGAFVAAVAPRRPPAAVRRPRPCSATATPHTPGRWSTRGLDGLTRAR